MIKKYLLSAVLIFSTASCMAEEGSAEKASPQVSAHDAKIALGKKVFEHWCTACHGRGKGHPGTAALEAKYNGGLPAVLEDRTDMTPESIKFYVRNGVSIMPFFRITEITREELKAMSLYLTQKNK